MTIKITKATGRAGCKTCMNTIAKDEYCLVYPNGQWKTNAYVHLNCVTDNESEMTFIKAVLQMKAQEGK